METKTIDCTPTWTQVASMCIALLEKGTIEGKKTAIEHIYKMATLADQWSDFTEFEDANPETTPVTFQKEEAQRLLHMGNKLTHKYFTDEEYVVIFNEQFQDETGLVLDWDEFWGMKNHSVFNWDWSIYNPIIPENKPESNE